MHDLEKIRDEESLTTDPKNSPNSNEAKHSMVSNPLSTSQHCKLEGEKVKVGEADAAAEDGKAEMPHHFIVWSETQLTLLGPENEDECPTELVDKCVREGRLTGTLTSWDKVQRLSPLKGDHGHSHAYERDEVGALCRQKESPRHIPINISSTSKVSQDSFGLGKSSTIGRASNETSSSTLRRLFKRQDTGASEETSDPTSPKSPLAILYDDLPTSPSTDKPQTRTKYGTKFSPKELFGTFGRSKLDLSKPISETGNDKDPAKSSTQSPLTKTLPATPSEDTSPTASTLTRIFTSPTPSNSAPTERKQSNYHHTTHTGRKPSSSASAPRILPWETSDDTSSSFITSPENSARGFGYTCSITANVPPKPKTRFFSKVSLLAGRKRDSEDSAVPEYKPVISLPIEPIHVAGIPPFSGPVPPPDLQAPRMSKEYKAQPNSPVHHNPVVESPDRTPLLPPKPCLFQQDMRPRAGPASAPLTQSKSTFSPRSIHPPGPDSPSMIQPQYQSQSYQPMPHRQLHSAPSSSTQSSHRFVENIPAVKATKAPQTPSIRTMKSQVSLRTMRSYQGPLNMNTTSPALPPGPEHEGWADAVKYVKEKVKAEKAQVKRAAKTRKKTVEEIKQEERAAKIKAGIQMIKRSSILGWVPRKAYDKLTEKDDEQIGMALEHKLAENSAGFNGLFKYVGIEQAKQDVIAAASVMAKGHPASPSPVKSEQTFETALNVIETTHQQQFVVEEPLFGTISGNERSPDEREAARDLAHRMLCGEVDFNQQQSDGGDPLGLAISGLESKSGGMHSSNEESSAWPAPLNPLRTVVGRRYNRSQDQSYDSNQDGTTSLTRQLRAAKSSESLAGSMTSLSRRDGSFRRKIEEISQSRAGDLSGQMHPADRNSPGHPSAANTAAHPNLRSQTSEPGLRNRARWTERDDEAPPVPPIPAHFAHPPQHRRNRARTNIMPTLHDRIDEEVEDWEKFSYSRELMYRNGC